MSFDDILVYSIDEKQHYVHLRRVLEILVMHTLYAKASKCSFGKKQVEYLGHIISEEGVGVDPSKIKSVQDWPLPQSIKALRGFLGLTGYCRKFVENYGVIAKPLTARLKKGNFKWTAEAEAAFHKLKDAMIHTVVLQLPDSSKPFLLETDASYAGIGAVLMQDKHPLAYLSKSLGPKSMGLSIYEKNFLAIILAIQKWIAYLICGTFVIRTDQKSLRYLLEQKITTPLQHKYLAKLMGFTYTIEYKKGTENRVADALSRKEEECNLTQITVIQPMWVAEVAQSYAGDSLAQEAIAECTLRPYDVSYFQYISGLIKYKGKLYVGESDELRQKIIQQIHHSNLGGHAGVQGTYQRIQLTFLWPRIKKQIKEMVESCPICQVNKPEHVRSPGLLRSLPIPDQAWAYITMDFIEQLPKSKGNEMIWVVVDRLTKYSHFIALAHPMSASTLAQVFIEEIYRLWTFQLYCV